jgi:hypothetical protein
MTEIIKGKVNRITERETQYGTMYNLDVAGNQIGIGKYPPKVAEGDYVKVPIERKGNYLNLAKGGRIEKIKPDEVPSSPPAASAGGKSYTPYNDDKRQEVISRQAARNSALTFLGQLLAAEAIAFPKTATPEKKAAILRANLEQLTGEFNNYAMGKDAPDVGTDPDAEEAGSNAGDFE